MSKCSIRCSDATEYASSLESDSIDLYILDPPFGIGETSFTGGNGGGSNRGSVIPGYQEAPEDYASFAYEWLTEVYRTLKPGGTAYVIMGWSYPLGDVMVAARDAGFLLLNHIIWHYNTQVIPTKKKFSSSHYHVLRLGKRKNGQTFNVPSDEDMSTWSSMPEGRNGMLSTYDKMDTWTIPKVRGKGTSNLNTLPDALVRKMILYSSNPGDLVCDLFMGNFTTAYMALQEGRRVTGCDINPNTCDHHGPILKERFGKGGT